MKKDKGNRGVVGDRYHFGGLKGSLIRLSMDDYHLFEYFILKKLDETVKIIPMIIRGIENGVYGPELSIKPRDGLKPTPITKRKIPD